MDIDSLHYKTKEPGPKEGKLVFTHNSEPSEHNELLSTLQQLVEPLAASVLGPSEVIIHDLSRLPRSIIAISGDVTGRTIGGPATDKLLSEAANGQLKTSIGYRTTSPTGKPLLSTTIILRNAEGIPAAALCINRDISQWEQLHALTATLTGVQEACPLHKDTEEEVFVHDLDELSRLLLTQAISSVHLPVEEMKKEHKVEVIRHLQAKGFFLLRDAAEIAAQALRCTRFSIYNYLNELNGDDK